jgi:hypothetical protein
METSIRRAEHCCTVSHTASHAHISFFLSPSSPQGCAKSVIPKEERGYSRLHLELAHKFVVLPGFPVARLTMGCGGSKAAGVDTVVRPVTFSDSDTTHPPRSPPSPCLLQVKTNPSGMTLFARKFEFVGGDSAELGKGQFSVVKKGRDRETGEVVAIKCIRKSEMTQEDKDALVIEKRVMQRVRAACETVHALRCALPFLFTPLLQRNCVAVL